MIKSIYFYDGSCWLITEDKPNIEEPFKIIDAGFGTSYNFEQIKCFSTYPDINILTNNPQLLSYDFCDVFYLYDFKNEKFRPIEEFTERDLVKTLDLRKMWVGGAFPNSKETFDKILN